MPVNLKDIDEVWLGLEQARAFLESEGYKPIRTIMWDGRGSWGGYVLWLLMNAQEAYKERAKSHSPTVPDVQSTTGL